MTWSVEVIGCQATAPSAAGAASSYLVRTNTGHVLVDAGPGSLLAYSEWHALSDLRGIIITHFHADHALDLMAWAYRWTFPTMLHRIPLFVPAGEVYRLEAFDELFGIPTLETMRRPLCDTFDVIEMPLDGSALKVDGRTFRAYPTRHAVPGVCLRFEGKTVVAFSSDTGDCPGLREAADGADVLVCESTYVSGHEEAIAAHGHLTAAQAGRIAVEAGVRRLVLTHFANADDGNLCVALAAEQGAKVVSKAVPGLVIA